jgi:dipeptidyl aminopeptidase/acylaminoacyl peptidase
VAIQRVALHGRTDERIESLLSARMFLEPRLADGRLYFISSLSGHLSLFAMDADGGVPEPLLPPQIALQNPELIGGHSFDVLPELGQLLVMIDHDGDEVYRPFVIPLEGGFPEPLAGDAFEGYRSHLVDVDRDAAVAYFAAESRKESLIYGLRSNLRTGEVDELNASKYGSFPSAWSSDHSRVFFQDQYLLGDDILYEVVDGERKVWHGTPIEEREEGREYARPGLRTVRMTSTDNGLLVVTTLYDDTGTPAYLPLDGGELEPVTVSGVAHEGVGELEGLRHLEGDRFAAVYNIDGCSWVYDASFDEQTRTLSLDRVLIGEDELAEGMVHGLDLDESSGDFAVSFCTATMPTQLYLLTPPDGAAASRTRERALGLPPGLLAAGEDASFESHDGLRVSARLYLPSPELGYEGPRPLVYYVHGGPQGQERPNFAWFSMPLIQILALEGFAVFVPNARGSTGYGLDYTRRVDRDWGGQDRLDHVHAMTEVLPKDDRIDVERAGVIGRSYGGYMTLTLAGRHPELWRAAVDMFGPYDLFTFMERIPETWKPYFALFLGDAEKDRDFLVDRSPKTHVSNISCPLFVIQGKNDPRVVEQESSDLVDELRAQGKDVSYLVFDDEGHDVLKLPNRVRCYDAITSFFSEHLGQPAY